MLELLWLIPALPFAGFVILIFCGSSCSRTITAITGTGAVALSAVVASLIAIEFIALPPAHYVYTEVLWRWVSLGWFQPAVAFYLDPLSLVIVLVVTWVSLLILVYSTWFMAAEDEGYNRFFAYMNLFVGSMLVLVLADNLLLLYLGWEGVGLCSYLLIGFWYRKEESARAALKAFVVTRIGDAAMAVGFFLIFNNLGTLNIQEAMARAQEQWLTGSALATAAAALLLGGALGKSAQIPLQTWLPDAMAAPTPVSALIHAATMVTAGVYLIARTHVCFTLAPMVQGLVAVTGALTILVAGSSAVVQRDIKRVLAYSTMSQIGYMFLALGAGAWIAAIFHFMIHAFFKALLFLGAGVIIQGSQGEHDIFAMGGMRKQLPLTFWTFLIGCASLSAVPFVTGGFYSKDLILLQVWTSATGGPLLFLAGLLGGLLTSVYSFRLVFVVFFGEASETVRKASNKAVSIPLVVMAVLALIGGFSEMPRELANVQFFSRFMENGLPAFEALPAAYGRGSALMILSCIVSLGGIYLAYLLFLKKPAFGEMLSARPPGRWLHRFFAAGWGFDLIYDMLLVRPFVSLARVNRNDFLDWIYRAIAGFTNIMHFILSITQSGNLRWYAMVVVLGAIFFIGVVILL